MKNLVTGKTQLFLAEPDQGGNVGYSITFKYSFDQDDILESFKYSDIEFSGPGTWDEYSCGEDYPIGEMMKQALSDLNQK